MQQNTFKKHLESQGKSQSTVQHYGTYILDFLSWLDKDNTAIEEATAKEVLSYLNHLQKRGQENKTRNIRLNVIKQFFNWQISQEQRNENPVAHLKIRGAKRQKLYPILSKQELESLYSTYEIPSENDPRSNRNWFENYKLSKARNKTILSLMINQGLTTKEVENLQQNDLQLKEGKIHIVGGRKSNKRTLELKSNQIIELMEYQYTTRAELLKHQENKESKRLFLPVPSLGKTKAKNSLQIWKSLTKEIKKNHSKFINFRQVRTSVITHWLGQTNLREVQYMAGHRYVSSTEAYLVNHTEDLQADIDAFHPMG